MDIGIIERVGAIGGRLALLRAVAELAPRITAAAVARDHQGDFPAEEFDWLRAAGASASAPRLRPRPIRSLCCG
jgi:hypothetical protein